MNISFFDPLSRGWQRMIQALFKPFDIKKWFIVGFTVFLAELLDHGSRAGGGYRFDGHHHNYHQDFEDLADLPNTILNWLAQHPVWAVLIVIGVLVLIVLMILLTWISSRGKFMFLDNVVFDRAKVAEPWRKFAYLGNSLFIWRLAFGIISIALISFLAVIGFFSLGITEGFKINIPGIVLLVLIFLFLIAVIVFISTLLNSFVVPIMYKMDMKTIPAWREFFKILWPHFFSFVLYFLFVVVLYIAAAIVIIAAGFAMCCIGFILLIIPYINTVVTLPISYTFRTYSLEFLAQFGNEYVLFPAENQGLQEPGSVE